MEKEKIVFLPVGPRGAGKSTYGQLLLEAHPTLKHINRDEILVRLFGSEHLSPYDGVDYYLYEVMTGLLERSLNIDTDVKLLFDSWTGTKEERMSLIELFRDYGATRVVALYFVTSMEDVETWFWQKPGIAKAETMFQNQGKDLVFYSSGAPSRDYKIFHQYASDIETDGFDEIIRVNPREKLITLF
jgi:predicted kinase